MGFVPTIGNLTYLVESAKVSFQAYPEIEELLNDSISCFFKLSSLSASLGDGHHTNVANVGPRRPGHEKTTRLLEEVISIIAI